VVLSVREEILAGEVFYEVVADIGSQESSDGHAGGEQALRKVAGDVDGKDIHDYLEVDDAEVDDGVAEVEGGETDVADHQHYELERPVLLNFCFERFYLKCFGL
jgi:hypothetical protein